MKKVQNTVKTCKMLKCTDSADPELQLAVALVPLNRLMSDMFHSIHTLKIRYLQPAWYPYNRLYGKQVGCKIWIFSVVSQSFRKATEIVRLLLVMTSAARLERSCRTDRHLNSVEDRRKWGSTAVVPDLFQALNTRFLRFLRRAASAFIQGKA